MRPARHHLIWPSKTGWQSVARHRPDLFTLPALQTWVGAGFPVISRRPGPGDDPSMWPVAIALPPAQGRLRLSFEMRPEKALRIMPPPLLLDALDGREALPDAWRGRIGSILHLGERLGIQPQMFGSLMWQTMTGLAFLRNGSDLDLLWPVDSWGHDAAVRLPALVDGLRRLDDAGPPRLDGELLFGRSGGVQWREWARAAPEARVLLKTDSEARLVPRSALLPTDTSP